MEKYDCLAARRGKGFMQGLVVTGRPVGEVINRAIENGLLVISAGSDVLRMVPPLVITKDDIDEMIEKLEKASGMLIRSFRDLKEALKKRMLFFDKMRCRASDHGLEYVMYVPETEENVRKDICEEIV